MATSPARSACPALRLRSLAVTALCGLAAAGATLPAGAAPALTASPAAAAPAQATGIAAVHRSGQTFLTWNQSVDANVERYRIYRHDAAIDAASLSQATLIWEGWEGSGDFHADRYFRPIAGVWEARYHDRYVIEDGGSELPAGTELLVWTLRDSDLGGQASLDAYYAVTAVDSSGVENVTDFGPGNATGAVTESVDEPAPVRTLSIVGNQAYVYIQYLDCRDVNVTFTAPNSENLYYGLDPQEPSIANAVSYAFTYVVLPPELNGCDTESSYPVLVRLHGHGGNTIRPMTADPDPTWCPVYRIYPTDIRNTWWFGNARDHDYRVDLDIQPTDAIVNYTEQRVLRMVRDLSRDPLFGAKVDLDRTYLVGHSMGGSGTLAMALRYPNVFAAAHASQPMTNYKTSGDAGGQDWKPAIEPFWGTIADAVPIELDGPEGLADHLKVCDGTPIWDWQNHQQQLVDRRGSDFVPMGIDHGLQDLIIEFATQGQPVYANLDQALTCWAGEVQDALHQPSGLSTIPMPYEPENGLPFHGFEAVLSETVPGCGDFSDDPPLPPVASGIYADSVTWSASWDNWDGDPIDTADLWQMALRTLDGATRTLDVTPRRLQEFTVEPGVEYVWANERIASGAIVRSERFVPDADGLLVVDDLQVTGVGNRLAIRRPFVATPESISVSAGGSQAMSLWAGDDQAGNIYVVLGTASGTTPGLPVGNKTLPLNIDAYFNATLTNPYSGAIQPAFATLDADGRAAATLTLPAASDPVLAGLSLHHAFVTLDVSSGIQIEVISNAEPLALTP